MPRMPVGMAIHSQGFHNRDTLVQSAGQPVGIAALESYWDTELRTLMHYIQGHNRPVDLSMPWRHALYGTYRTVGSAGGFQIGLVPQTTGTINDTLDDNGPARKFQTGAVINTPAGWDTYNTNNGLFYREASPLLICRIKLTSVADIRFFFGVASASAVSATMTGADAPAATHYAGIQFSTARPDVNFQLISSETVAQTITDTGVAADANWHTIILKLDHVNTLLWAWIDGVAVSHATHLPATSTNLGYIIANQNLVAVDKEYTMKVAHMLLDG